MDIRDVRSRRTKPTDESHATRSVVSSPVSGSTTDRSDDRVTLSARTQALEETRLAALNLPEVRVDRVDAVRSRLADGSFSVDTKRIAQSLLDQGLVQF